MELAWGRVLWCEDCEEIMKWNRHSRTWTCPACDEQVSAEMAEDAPVEN